MEKKITYKGKEYNIEITWSGSAYCFRIIGLTGFKTIPNDCMNSIIKIKDRIIDAFETKSDLYEIEKWDGNLD